MCEQRARLIVDMSSCCQSTFCIPWPEVQRDDDTGELFVICPACKTRVYFYFVEDKP